MSLINFGPIPSYDSFIKTYAGVATYKQEKMEKNLLALQQSIEKASSLDIDRPVDKAYYESKLNDVLSRVKKFAFADLSNMGVATHMNNIVNTLYRDENVVSAMTAQATRKAEFERLKKDKESGKYNPANEYDFLKNDSKWYNSNTVGEKYNNSYFSPVDFKEIYQVLKDVGVDETVIHNLYETNPDGSIKLENGVPKFNEIAIETIVKGRDPSKVLTALRTAMTPAHYKQLEIEGRYMYQTKSKEQISEEIKSTIVDKLNFADQQIKRLDTLLFHYEANPDFQTSDLVRNLKEQRKFYENYKNETLEKFKSDYKVQSLDDPINMTDEEADAYRGKLYTENFIHNMAKSFSNVSRTDKPYVSHYFTIMTDKKKLEIMENELKLRQQDLLLRANFNKEQQGNTNNWTDYTGNTEMLQKEYVDNFYKQFRDSFNEYNNTNRQILEEYYRYLYRNESSKFKTNGEFNNYIRQKMYNDLTKKYGVEHINFDESFRVNDILDREAFSIIYELDDLADSNPVVSDLLKKRSELYKNITQLKSVEKVVKSAAINSYMLSKDFNKEEFEKYKDFISNSNLLEILDQTNMKFEPVYSSRGDLVIGINLITDDGKKTFVSSADLPTLSGMQSLSQKLTPYINKEILNSLSVKPISTSIDMSGENSKKEQLLTLLGKYDEFKNIGDLKFATIIAVPDSFGNVHYKLEFGYTSGNENAQTTIDISERDVNFLGINTSKFNELSTVSKINNLLALDGTTNHTGNYTASYFGQHDFKSAFGKTTKDGYYIVGGDFRLSPSNPNNVHLILYYKKKGDKNVYTYTSQAFPVAGPNNTTMNLENIITSFTVEDLDKLINKNKK